MKSRRMFDGVAPKRYFRPEVWVPIIIASIALVGGALWAGGGIAQSVENHGERLTKIENNNQQLQKDTSTIAKHTELMQKAQDDIKKDIRTILNALTGELRR